MANNWNQDELLLTLHLYCRTHFGKLHKGNPDIIQLANIIGRTPSAVAMKACNFASLYIVRAQKVNPNTQDELMGSPKKSLGVRLSLKIQ